MRRFHHQPKIAADEISLLDLTVWQVPAKEAINMVGVGAQELSERILCCKHS